MAIRFGCFLCRTSNITTVLFNCILYTFLFYSCSYNENAGGRKEKRHNRIASYQTGHRLGRCTRQIFGCIDSNLHCIIINTALLHHCLGNRSNRSRRCLVWIFRIDSYEHDLHCNWFICKQHNE